MLKLSKKMEFEFPEGHNTKPAQSIFAFQAIFIVALLV